MMEYHSETYCDICGDSFHTKEILPDHKLEHTEELNADKVISGRMHVLYSAAYSLYCLKKT